MRHNGKSLHWVLAGACALALAAASPGAHAQTPGILGTLVDAIDRGDSALVRQSLADPAFRFESETADRNAPPADHVTTRYEEKKLGDCAPVFLDFVRV